MDSSKSKLPKPKIPVAPMTDGKQNIQSNKQTTTRSVGLLTLLKYAPRRSKSMVNLNSNAHVVKKPLAVASRKEFKVNTAASTSTTRSTFKRPAATKAESDIKCKVSKQAKIPDWDYKSRFNQLNEKHKQLLEAHNKLKAEREESEERNEHFHTTISKLREKMEKLENELDDLRNSYQELSVKNDETMSDNETLLKNSEELSDQLKQSTNLYKVLQGTLATYEKERVDNEVLRRKLHNTIQDLKGNIRVFCRIRPPVNDVENEKAKCLINYVNESTMEIRSSRESASSTGGKPSDTKLEFTFDQVFNETSTQLEFFDELAQLVQSAIDGYNVCVFAYGQTGSGKTYTMQGLEDSVNMGMIPRSINLIFTTINNLEKYKWEYEVTVSFLEIYNENVRDLLDPNVNHTLDILYNEGRGTTVSGLTVERIKSPTDFKRFMKIALKNRAVAATDFNEHSSRSHAITKISISGRSILGDTFYSGCVNLVDLAGSESGKTSMGARLVETKNINKSLSALGSVMLALHNKDKHIPYRNSKLTYLLQSSLGGNSKTLMIVNISPFEESYAESINSLRFASKVKQVKTKVKRNKTNVSD